MFEPDASDVAAYLIGTSGELSWELGLIEEALEAEKAAQARVCRMPESANDWPADMAEALKRRVARNLALRGLPLGLQTSMSEAAVATVRVGSDPEIRRLEAPWRRLVVG